MSAVPWPNVAAEEGAERPPAAKARIDAVAAWFESLFEPPLPFEWLGRDGVFAWLNDASAEAHAKAQGLPLVGAPAEVCRRVHDKAFALRVAASEGQLPRCLHGLVEVIEPAALEAPGAAASLLARAAEWPEWTGGRFTLKPRFGTSGRGRVGGVAGETSAEDLAGAMGRLARRGGAILEPWLSRREDFSVQLHLGDEGVVLLGVLTQVTTGSGQAAGHRGILDARGRVNADTRFEDAALEAALGVAQAARVEGYRGPCGVDSFSFLGPDGELVLRPVVELNARFTLGTLVVGALRRALPRAREELGLGPGRLVAFATTLAAAGAGPPGEGPGLLRLPQAGGAADLWLAEDARQLDACFGSVA
ncbi:MAG: hypothetical protein QNK05_05445 [Myxococcota bacterium]|nr:hypothetical protein [Myxococcota bacterium]